jgi:hypothetical protein
MECKFLSNGIAIGYDNIIKPCCAFKFEKNDRKYKIGEIDLSTYHSRPEVLSLQEKLKDNVFPNQCRDCKKIEEQGRGDSVRLNGEHAYANYKENDITLEIRPGNVCNFACQTCWPAASSRVTSFYQQAGLDVQNPVTGPNIDDTYIIKDYNFLLPIAEKIKDVIILGGEPFYDKNCLAFMHWAIKNLTANITLFTNTSIIKEDLIRSYNNTVTIVSSIDAIGRPAEYIRFGTVWEEVDRNFKKLKTFKNVRQRVNITCSAYNFYFIDDIIKYLINDWPEVVSFGVPKEKYFSENVLPLTLRPAVIEKLNSSIKLLMSNTEIKLDQKQNAINALTTICSNLLKNIYDLENHQYLKNFSKKMDMVKNINYRDYHDYFVELLS